MNGPDPPHWTVISCFGASRSVWVYLAIFRYTKLGAKWIELVHLAMFHYYTNLVAKRVELVQLMHKFVPWSRFGIFHNESTWPTPLDPKLMFWCARSIWVHLAMFCYYTKLGPKRVELVQLMQKFVLWSRFKIFRNERTRSTPLDHKFMFWWIS